MVKYLFFLVICCAAPVTVDAQQTDSVKVADSLKKASAIKLNTVTIRGQRPAVERRVDGIVFNVESLPSIAGADASDVLRKVPMVSVDGNGSLAVRGSSNVKVLIDGKPSEIYAPTVTDALRTLRAEQIVKVEVITDPSARYDAQGTDAVINIITRKLKDNITNGNVGAMPGNRSGNLIGDIHHQRGALQLHADVAYQLYRNKNGSVLVRNTESTALSQQTETRQTGHNLNGGFNVLYSLDSLNTINAGFRSRRSVSTTDAVVNNYNTGTGYPEFLFRRDMNTPGSSVGYSYTLGFSGQAKGRKTEYVLLGTFTPSENNGSYRLTQYGQNNSLYYESFTTTTVNSDYMIQADYAHTFTGEWKIESGAKLAAKNARSNSLYEPDAGRSATFWYDSKVYAAYTNFTFRLNKWGFSTGLRYEYTGLDAVFKSKAAVNRYFGNVAPQALVQLEISDKASLKLGYTRKLLRPFFSYLDPTVNTSDSLTLQYGNPQLDPETTNRYQLSYSVNNPKLFTDLALSFNDNRNSIENIRTPINNGRFESTWQNVGKNKRLALSASFNWKPSVSFTMGGALTATYVKLESKALSISNSGIMRQLTLNASYKLPNGYSLDSYLYFDGNNLRLQGYRSGWRFYNLTLNKKFKGDRLSMSLRGEAFLTRHAFIDEVIESANYSQRQTYRYQNQNLRLTVSYKIGKREVKSLQVKPINND
ncbi:MAG: outer membrane beta-barrel family protein [Bacteroidota bacterium]